LAILLGVHEDKLSRFQTQLGHPVQVVRLFMTAGEAFSGNTLGSKWNLVQTYASMGLRVHVSWKSSSSWAAIAGGSDDVRAQNIGNRLAGITPAGWFSFHHEPQGNGTASDYVAAFTRFMNIIKPLASAWRSSNVYVGGTFWFGNGGGPDPWWTPGVDNVGCDTYNRRGAADGASQYATPSTAPDEPTTLLTVPRQSGRQAPYPFAQGHGVTLTIPELGCAITDPNVDPNYAVKRANWLLAVANNVRNLPGIEYVAYYDHDSSDGNVPDWAISGGDHPPEPASLAAFYQFSQTSVTPTVPTISSFSPTTGLPSITVTIFGTNFTGATAVRFGGVAATFGINSATRIDAVVPALAVTGAVTVTTPQGTATSAVPFVVGTNPDPGFSGAGVVPPMTRVRQAG